MICIYHKNCMDGLAAAWVVNKFNPNQEIEFIAAQYGDSIPEVQGQIIYIVDFSWPKDDLEVLNRNNQVIILDHHKTAKEQLQDLPYAHFEDNLAGCVMTWNYFSNKSVPLWMQYIQDRDLWTWKLQKSKEVNAAMRSYPASFESLDKFHEKVTHNTLVHEGQAILRQQSQLVQSKVQDDRISFETIGGYEVPCLNCTEYISEVGNELAQNYVFAAMYFDTSDKRVFSLRSVGDFDVSEIAKQYGGGGHRNAAGFTIDKPKVI